MKRLLCLIFTIHCSLLTIHCSAQSPDWLWSKSAGGSGWDQASGIVTDASGNVFMTGIITSDSVKFDKITLSKGMFLAKYDGSGKVIWAQNVGNGFPTSLALDTSGNIYTFSGLGTEVSFTYWNNKDTTRLAATEDLSLAKFDKGGKLIWAKGYGSYNNNGNLDYPNGVSTDVSGNVFITGYFASDSMRLRNTIFYNKNSSVGFIIFVAKINGDGTLLWANDTSPKGTNGNLGVIDQAMGITCDANGNAYITGVFVDTTITFSPYVLSGGVGVVNYFLVKYNRDGIVKWAKTADTKNDFIWGSSVAYDHHGNIYLSGWFDQGSVTIGTSVLNNTYNGVNNASTNLFIAKYDTLGNAIWAKNAGGTQPPVQFNNIYPLSVISDEPGNAYIAGIYNSPDIEFGKTTITNNSENTSYDFFLAKYDGSGNAVWAKDISYADFDNWTGTGIGVDAFETELIASDNSGNIYIGGYFGAKSLTFGSNSLTCSGNSDLFLAKLPSVVTNIAVNTDPNVNISIYPNPVNEMLNVECSILNREQVTLKIFDITGMEVGTIADGVLDKGDHTIKYNIKNLSSGVYFIRFTGNNEARTIKMIKE